MSGRTSVELETTRRYVWEQSNRAAAAVRAEGWSPSRTEVVEGTELNTDDSASPFLQLQLCFLPSSKLRSLTSMFLLLQAVIQFLRKELNWKPNDPLVSSRSPPSLPSASRPSLNSFCSFFRTLSSPTSTRHFPQHQTIPFPTSSRSVSQLSPPMRTHLPLLLFVRASLTRVPLSLSVRSETKQCFSTEGHLIVNYRFVSSPFLHLPSPPSNLRLVQACSRDRACLPRSPLFPPS